MIIDASVGVKWLVLEAGTDAANRLIDSGDRLIVPVLFHSEVGNALWKRARRGEVASNVVVGLLGDLRSLVETIEEREVMPRALEIATMIDHPIYDCVYVALTERRGDELLTADTKFVRKVRGTPFSQIVKEL